MSKSSYIARDRPDTPIDAWEDVRPEIKEFKRPKRGKEKGNDGLEDYQIQTVNSIESRFFGGGDVEQGNSYLLADGTGSGKTTVLLDTAVQVNNQTDLASVIVVKDNLSIQQGLDKAEKLRINLDDRKISYCRYDQLAERLEHAKPGELGLVACDEAHVLSLDANRPALEALKEFPGFKLYATATACGSVDNILLFEELIHGTPPAETAKDLGLKPELDNKKPTGKYEVPKPETFLEKLEEKQKEMAEEGAMSKLEFPLWGKVRTKVVGSDKATDGLDLAEEQSTIARSLADGKVGMDDAIHQLRALSEYSMAEKVARDVEFKISRGQAVILYANSDSVPCPALSEEPFNGTIPSLASVVQDKLKEACKENHKLAKHLGKILSLQDPEPYQNFNEHQVTDVFQAKKSSLVIVPPSLNEGINGLCEMDEKNPRKTNVFVAGFDPELPLGPSLVQMYGRAFRNKAESPSQGRTYFAEGSLTDKALRNELLHSLQMLKASGSGVADVISESIEKASEKDDHLHKKQKKHGRAETQLSMPEEGEKHHHGARL